MALNNIAKIAPPKENTLEINYWQVPFYIHASASSIKQNIFDAWREKTLSHVFLRIYYGNNSFAEVPKIQLDTNLKIFLFIDH